MPEADLRAFLRVFLPEERIEPALDAIALMGLEIEASDPLELFVLAHMELQQDPRVSVDMEAAVLVEEVGMPVDDVGAVLDLGVAEVEQAVARAWADSGLLDGAELAPAAAPPEAEDAPADLPEARDAETPEARPQEREAPAVEAAAEHASAAEDGAAATAARAEPATDGQARPWRSWVAGVAVALAGIAILAALAFSEAGRARLQLQGIDPVVVLLVIVGLVGAGVAFLRAGAGPTASAASAEHPPTAGQHEHQADQHGGGRHQRDGEERGVPEA